HVHSNDRISSNPIKKQSGLDRFYKKYKLYFSERLFQHSIKRATTLFQYQVSKPKQECIIILMALHNNETTVCNALSSILNQQATNRLLYIFVSDDNSTDESVKKVQLLSNQFQNIILFKNNFNSASKNRQWLQSKVINEYPECVFIGRLDADDTLNEIDVLQRIETLWDDTNFDVLIMANNQYLNEEFTGFINKPGDDLLNTDKLLVRLNKMAQGAWDAELPSCNVFVRPTIAIPYEELNSAEDHRNLVDYLLKGNELNIQIRSNWIYCNYRIDKHVNAKPEVIKIKAKVRNDLYIYALNQTKNNMRKLRARNILEKWKNGNYHYLGAGFSGVVFHDEQWVYKVHLPLSTNNFNEIDNILFLKEKLHLFHGRKHFYPLRELTFFEEAYILVYPYEKGEKVTSLSREDMLGFLSEMWAMKVLCRSITKENNFIRVNGVIKLIDYEIESYHDNLFLNTAARAFIQTDEFEHREISYNKLKRSTINDFTLPELSGFDEFVCELFKRCHHYNFKPLILPIQCTFNIDESILYNGENNPAVSLLIKACVQDSSTLYNDVLFLVSQLTKKISFLSRCLLLDIYKEDKFLRQYNQFGEVGELMDAAKRLKDEGIIDKIIIPPIEKHTISEINFRWFDILNNTTHTQNGVPVTSQLYAFEEAPGDYILQMDVDVLIGLKEANFDYLKDMVFALSENNNAVSIGFQIYQDEGIQKQKISGMDANIPPDVRCCLLHKKRLLSARPFINQPSDHGWQLSWYRALENYQKINGIVSLRGGDTRAYYIHPPNYRKQNRWVWHTLKMSVKQGLIPTMQIGKVDVAGNIYDWCLPKRHEEFIVLLYIKQRDTTQLQSSLQSIFEQDYSAFGLILINNTGDCTFLESFREFISLFNCHTTIIEFENTVLYYEAIYKAIHYYLNNQDSFICLLMQGDILLYTSVFSECINRLKIYDADLLIGKEVSSRTVVNAGMVRTNFIHPREDAESLCNGLAIFRKYLFDALSIFDLKRPVQGKPNLTSTFSKIKVNYEWLDDTSNISLLVPITELSRNPIRFDYFNVLRCQPVAKYQLEEAIHSVKTKQPKVEGSWEKGRKTFLPNTNKIELDITYDCNLKCFHCNRSCTQAP
ncbi:MAG: glycosyltransferase family 2 protein, partial [Chitinophagaceae bacterium]|nr:glycosyltransferase family 2 protein [Chitinophagaceae bacterium]